VDVAGLTLPRLVVLAASLSVPFLMWEMGARHYRGNFYRWPMVLPLVVPPVFAAAGFLVLATSAAWAVWTYAVSASLVLLVALAGLFFHIQGIARQTGGFRFDNVMVGPPMLAPLSFGGVALLGLLALAFWS
jgi:hypothetical protein